MYGKLKDELGKKGITGSDLAELLEIRRDTVYNKINGKSGAGFTLDEALKVKEKFFPEYSVEDLFKKEDQ